MTHGSPVFQEYIAFREDDRARVGYMFAGTAAFEKLAWYETLVFHRLLVGLFALVFLSASVVWPLGRFIRRLRKGSTQTTRENQLTRSLSGLVGILNLTFLIGLATALSSLDVWHFVDGVPATVVALLFIPLVAIVLTPGLAVVTVLTWKNNQGSRLERFHHMVMALTALLFIPFLVYWNLLGFHF